MPWVETTEMLGSNFKLLQLHWISMFTVHPEFFLKKKSKSSWSIPHWQHHLHPAVSSHLASSMTSALTSSFSFIKRRCPGPSGGKVSVARLSWDLKLSNFEAKEESQRMPSMIGMVSPCLLIQVIQDMQQFTLFPQAQQRLHQHGHPATPLSQSMLS